MKTKHWNKQTHKQIDRQTDTVKLERMIWKENITFMGNGIEKPVLEEYKRFPLQIRNNKP